MQRSLRDHLRLSLKSEKGFTDSGAKGWARKARKNVQEIDLFVCVYVC